MATHRFFLCLFSLCILVASCKNDTKEGNLETATERTVTTKKDLTEEEREARNVQANNMMVKAMTTEDVSTFTRGLVTVSMSETLANTDEEFTLLAPENGAFNILGDGQTILNDPSQREALKKLLQSHIVVGTVDSATMFQEVQKSETLTLTTINGEKLVVSKEGDNLIVTNQNGTKATIGKSDIKGSNGVLHVLDTLLQ